MRKILWYSPINELDYEQQMLFEHLGHAFRLAIPDSGNDYFFPVKARIDDTGIVTREQMVALIRDFGPDLVVFRYRRDSVELLAAAEETGVPVLVWVTEQGPDRDLEWDRNRHFRNLAVNNIWDQHYYKNRGIENVYYWPFGCLPWFHRRVEPREPYIVDCVGYGNPIYRSYDSKRDSVDTVVRPLVEKGFQVALWGRRSGASGGWLDVPGVLDGVHYKGTFDYDDIAVVNSSARIVLGITSNGRYGAFGSRLARAMACGSFCIWAYSEGMEEMEEGYKNHENCCWSSGPDETVDIARYYLKNEAARERIALAGQKLAYEKLNYVTMVPPIIEDVIARHPRPSHTRYHALGRLMQKQLDDDRLAEACWTGYRVIAHDATGFTSEMAIGMARSFIEQKRYHQALRYLERFADILQRLLRRNDRSCDDPRLSGEIGKGYGQVYRLVERVVADLATPRAEGAADFLRGLLAMEGRRGIVQPMVTELARRMASHLHNSGAPAASLRALHVYQRLHRHADLPAESWRKLTAELAELLPRPPAPLQPPVDSGGASKGRPRPDVLPSPPPRPPGLLPSHWDFFLEAAATIPLDRRQVLLAGDCIRSWADHLCHNRGGAVLFRTATPLDEPDLDAGWQEIPDPRPHAQVETVMAELRSRPLDALLYLVLVENASHWQRLQQLVALMPAGSCVVVAGAGSAANLRQCLEAIGLRSGWQMAFEGARDFDFEPGHPLSSALAVVGAWKELTPVARLMALAGNLSHMLEPRISHVTLDPLEIRQALYAWSEGYVRLMQQACRTEGMDAAAWSLIAAPSPGEEYGREREHTLLEVRLDGRTTTWDPMLGMGYEGSLQDLLRQPDRASSPLGRHGKHWDRYHLDRLTGRDFFAAVRQVARRDDLEAPPRFEPAHAAEKEGATPPAEGASAPPVAP